MADKTRSDNDAPLQLAISSSKFTISRTPNDNLGSRSTVGHVHSLKPTLRVRNIAYRTPSPPRAHHEPFSPIANVLQGQAHATSLMTVSPDPYETINLRNDSPVRGNQVSNRLRLLRTQAGLYRYPNPQCHFTHPRSHALLEHVGKSECRSRMSKIIDYVYLNNLKILGEFKLPELA
jgi:hypothetical protein